MQTLNKYKVRNKNRIILNFKTSKKMEEIKKMSFADLKAIFDYCRLILDDAMEENDKQTVIGIEPILSALNDEMDSRMSKIVKLLKS